MKIKNLKIRNFRGYKDEVDIDFDDFTAFVGKNDIGKSTILEALDIFFNEGKGIIKLDKDDINKQALAEDDVETVFTVCFEELPEKIVIDATYETDLAEEFLLNEEGQLELKKKFTNAGSPKVFIRAYHPTNEQCRGLLQKTDRELRRIIDDNEITCTDRNKNAIMRKAIWNHYQGELQLGETEIDITKGETKAIWEKLHKYLPMYSLFQSDRKNTDSDDEVQDPLQEAVKQILNDTRLQEELEKIANEVQRKLEDVSNRTLDKLREMSPEVANSLNPVIPKTSSLKWSDVFKKVSISGDDDIPINKRGSGVKRLILLNFFRAEAENRIENNDNASIIYAIEEPETSQHTENQKKLAEALLNLAKAINTQVIITTHSSTVVKKLDYSDLRLITNSDEGKKIERVLPGQLPYPSLNEVNYLAFSEITEEYHNELYGYIEAEGQWEAYKAGKNVMPYVKVLRNGNIKQEQVILTEYIRHQIHHPENTNNVHFTEQQLEASIKMMREFVQTIV